MPDKEGRLTAQERDTFAAYLNQFISGTRLECPVCKRHDWAIQAHATVMVPISGDAAVQIVGAVYPQVSIVCTTCSHIMSFMAQNAGVKFDGD